MSESDLKAKIFGKWMEKRGYLGISVHEIQWQRCQKTAVF
jgi:hypothetical protein